MEDLFTRLVYLFSFFLFLLLEELLSTAFQCLFQACRAASIKVLRVVHFEDFALRWLLLCRLFFPRSISMGIPNREELERGDHGASSQVNDYESASTIASSLLGPSLWLFPVDRLSSTHREKKSRATILIDPILRVAADIEIGQADIGLHKRKMLVLTMVSSAFCDTVIDIDGITADTYCLRVLQSL